jgi:predicted nuclease of predicted toxin-antitoxin system
MKKLKLDENFPPSLVSIFRENNIDASSVFEQVCGSDDDNVFDVCLNEERALVTFDLDFANIIRYPAAQAHGIIVIRSKKKMSIVEISNICVKIVSLISHNHLAGKLFIVEDSKVRIRSSEE